MAHDTRLRETGDLGGPEVRDNRRQGRLKDDGLTCDGAIQRLRRARGPASANPCSNCSAPVANQWRLIESPAAVETCHEGRRAGQSYSPNPTDYRALCKACLSSVDQPGLFWNEPTSVVPGPVVNSSGLPLRLAGNDRMTAPVLARGHRPRPPDDKHVWLTSQQVADVLEVSRERVNQLTLGGSLASTRVGQRHWFRQSDVEAIAASRATARELREVDGERG